MILDFKLNFQAHYQLSKKPGRRDVQTCDESESLSPTYFCLEIYFKFLPTTQEGKKKVSKEKTRLYTYLKQRLLHILLAKQVRIVDVECSLCIGPKEGEFRDWLTFRSFLK